MTNKEIEELFNQAKTEELIGMNNIEKHCFTVLLSGMIAKLLTNKSEEAQRQLQALQRMERFMER